MADYMNHHVAKAVQNRTNGNIMAWWKTNFNMPTPDVTDPGSGFPPDWIEGFGPVAYDSVATSFDLSGFLPGMEIVVFGCIWHWDGPYNGTAYLNSRWCDTSNNTIFTCANNLPMVLNIGIGVWAEYWHGCNIGVAGWEVDTSGDYYVKSSSTGTGAQAEQSTTITFSNVPSTTQLGSEHPGYIWVEGNDLAYINANEWKHKIVGTSIGYVDTAKEGYIWIDNSDDLHWIGANGNDYKVPWKIQEFASTWTNSSNDATAPGQAYEGNIWVDSEYGYTHLAYIGHNGHKFLVGMGNYPYVLSY